VKELGKGMGPIPIIVHDAELRRLRHWFGVDTSAPDGSPALEILWLEMNGKPRKRKRKASGS